MQMQKQMQSDSVSSLRSETGADAPPWNTFAASVLRKHCGLSGEPLRRNLAWWKRVRDRGKARNVGDEDIAAAIRGLHRVMRIDLPWWPCRMFKRANHALWLEAMSAGRKVEDREARKVGSTPLIQTLERLAREAR